MLDSAHSNRTATRTMFCEQEQLFERREVADPKVSCLPDNVMRGRPFNEVGGYDADAHFSAEEKCLCGGGFRAYAARNSFREQ